MDTYEDGQKRIKTKLSEQDIVPVHTSSNAQIRSINESYNLINHHTIMKVKDEEEQEKRPVEKSSDIDISDWLWGGTLGGKGTVLVFRSCVLAPKEKTYPYSSKNSFIPSGLSSNNDLDKKIPPIANQITLEARSSGMTNIDSENTSSNWELRSLDDSDTSTETSVEVESNSYSREGPDMTKKRDIRDVLNDINKITFKRKHNVINSTADVIKLSQSAIQSTSTDDDINSGYKAESRKVLLNSVPNTHIDKINFENLSEPKNYVSSSSKSSAVNNGAPNTSFNFETPFSDIYYKDYRDVKIPEKTQMPASLLNLSYKTAMTETKLLSRILHAHGFTGSPHHSKEYSLLWTGLHPKPDLLRSLSGHQRVNHFPRSYELTRKDKLFKNIEKMQHFRGSKNFDFIPLTFLMPVEYRDLCSAHYRTKGPWIIKPAASSRGRGIYIVNSPDKIPKAESVVVAKYIDKPLLVDGHKCDLRLYVCVTSFDPLLIYMYEEGLVRFATVKYDKTNKNLWNPCMHLCNYSINKYHSDYIKCEDPSAENVGHKWTLSALLRHLRRDGRDTGTLMTAIEDVVIKSILSCTQSIAGATKMFVPHFSNCFELYGFDILIDDALKPWLLEINLSPSLGCDSPLDARLKSSLLADTLTLIGIPASCPGNKVETTSSSSPQASNKPVNLKMRIVGCNRVHSAENMSSSMKKGFGSTSNGIPSHSNGISFLTNDEQRIIKIVKGQYERRGGYVRIFPSQDSWQKYAQYLDPVSGIPVCNTSVINVMDPHSLIPRNYNLLVHSQVLLNFDQSIMTNFAVMDPPERLLRYERVLPVCPRVSLDSAGSSKSSSSVKTPLPDSKTAKLYIKHQLELGMHLTPGESRRAFGMFLNCVLKRISNSKSEQAAHHADLIHRFLKRAAGSLKMPYNLKNLSPRMSDKDKAAMIAKQLNDFLYIYHRETDMYTNSTDEKDCIRNINFSHFIYGANEADLEDLLLTVLKLEGNVASFLGDRQSPQCIDMPPPAITQQPGKSYASRHHQLLRYLTYVTPLHSRRYQPPSLDCVFPAVISEDATTTTSPGTAHRASNLKSTSSAYSNAADF